MTVRAISGAVYVALIVAAILLGLEWFAALMMLFTALAITELEHLLGSRAHLPLQVTTLDVVCAMLLVAVAGCMGIHIFEVMWGVVCIAAIVLLLYLPTRMIMAVADHGQLPARAAIYSLFAIGYIGFPLAMLTWAYYMGSWMLVLATFVFIWLNDTGAYLSGRAFGRNKLCERLSPKKTREGFWGGFVITAIGGAVAAWLIPVSGVDPAVWYPLWIIYAMIISVLSTFGDLFESMIKRTLDVKDSGNLIPGHGGILDRIDSLLACAPTALLFALIIYGLVF